MRRLRLPIAAAILFHAAVAAAQTGAVPAARVNVLAAEDRRAATPRDLTTIRNAIRSTDAETARIAIRAAGRLERPSLIADLLPALRFRLPETRAEAATAVAQAAQGWPSFGVAGGRSAAPAAGTTPLTPDTVLTALADRLELEDTPNVRAALCEAMGRLPYRTAAEIERAESVLLDHAGQHDTVTDLLGVARGLETLLRINREHHRPGSDTIALLRAMVGVSPHAPAEAVQRTSTNPDAPVRRAIDSHRAPRIRRLALEALLSADVVDGAIIERAIDDPDAQVRRLAMRAAGVTGRGAASLAAGLADLSPLVRLEALRASRAYGSERACAVALDSTADIEISIVLVAIDQLAACTASPAAVAALERIVTDLSEAGSLRGWHKAAHAIVALATAAPERARALIAPFLSSRRWQLRMYAARAAATLGDRAALERLATDAHDNVVEAAIGGLSRVAGHAADPTYMAALSGRGYQAVRAAALALAGTADDTAKPALQAAWQRLVDEGHDNSRDTRAAIATALTRLGAPPAAAPVRAPAPPAALTGVNLRRLAAPLARITIRGVGTFDVALFATEAPVTVVRFCERAEAGYYNGLTFHRVVPNFVVQGGSPAANEYVGVADHARDEVGAWPHVRGAVGISTRGRDTGDGQFFINLVDNPRLDHEYTVFGQVLNGIEVVDRILEGDTIERIEILP